MESILPKNNKATQLLGLQSNAVKKLHTDGLIDNFRFLSMHDKLTQFSDHQGRSERIKNFPYPRQYATISTLLVKLFCLTLPFALLREVGNPWYVIPFSVLVSWVYTSLDQVGESTENPFEGNPNDVPISQLSRNVEIDIRELLGEVDLPPALQPQNEIIM